MAQVEEKNQDYKKKKERKKELSDFSRKNNIRIMSIQEVEE